jgi:DNA (cytosine-5)-methyltransferase 1
MITNQLILPIHDEIVVDLFAGGGGASTGIEMAIGRYVDIAINHDPEAVSLHAANHPQTQHYCEDVFDVDPCDIVAGRPVGLLWASPDCKHFSKAKGGKPVSKKIRSLAWVIVKWAKLVRPRIICLENVEEFQTWGPLGTDNMPDTSRRGETFRRWISELEKLGYAVEWRELRACDYGAPTIRKRLFLIARRDGRPIVWPAPTHSAKGGGGLKKWRTAAECIDWSLPCPSIFERKRPLSENTMRRIAKGIKKFVIDNPHPFIVQVNHSGDGFRGQDTDKPMHTLTAKNGYGIITPFLASRYTWNNGDSAQKPLCTITTKGYPALITPSIVSIANYSSESIRNAGDPLSTVTANPKGGHHALITPVLAQMGYGEGKRAQPRADTPERPLWTVTSGGNHAALVSAFIVKYYGGVVGSDVQDPLGTVTSIDHNALSVSHIVKFRGTNTGSKTDSPLHTISAGGIHAGEIRSFLIKYYGNEKDGASLDEPCHTIPTKDRFGLVIVHIKGVPYVITDIGLRMLTPKELYAAQGFPAHYHFDKGADGSPLTKTAQVRMCGNSVCPPMAEAIVRDNY